MAGDLDALLESRRVNTLAGWSLVAFLSAVGVGELLLDQAAWGLFILCTVAVALVPPAKFRTPTAMLPWEVLALAALPAAGRAFVAGFSVGGMTFTGRLSTYLAVAAVALMLAVELDVFTPVEMSRSFAVLFVAVATTAAAGVWALVQWVSDLYLGTGLLLGRGPEPVVEEALMWDFVAATLAGAVAGAVFVAYFRRLSRPERRVPDEVLAEEVA